MGKVLNDLVYGNYVPTYAGKPIAEADETAGVLEDRYYSNKDSADKLEIAIANLEVHEKDQAIKDDAYNKLKAGVQGVLAEGDWENASMLVRNETKNFATNQGIMEALESNKGKQTQVAAATERVGKSEEENGILLEDVKYEQSKAEENYQGVQYDPKTNTYSGHWSMGKIPKYINMGDRVDKFLTGFKADQHIGRMTGPKGESRVIIKKDDKWIWAEEGKTADGSYIYQPSTEEVPFEQVLQAARKHLLQDGEVRERIAYDSGKNSKTFDEYALATGQTKTDARAAMADDLVNILGFNQAEVDNMSDDQILANHKQESVVYNSIIGPTAKHSYVKETATSFGMPWWAKQAAKGESAAGAGGGNYTTVPSKRIIHEHYTQAYSVDGVKNLSTYTTAKKAALDQVALHGKSYDAKRAEIVAAKAQGQNTANLEDDLENIQINLDKFKAAAADLDMWQQYAKEKLVEEYGEDAVKQYVAKQEEMFKDPKMVRAKQHRDEITDVLSGFGTYSLAAKEQRASNPDNEGFNEIGGFSPIDANAIILDEISNDWGATWGNAERHLKAGIVTTKARMKKEGKLTPEMETKFAEAEAKLTKEFDAFYNSRPLEDGTTWKDVDKYGKFEKSKENEIGKKMNAKMKEISENRTYQYTFVDLSMNPAGSDNTTITKFGDVSGRSPFTQNMTAQVRQYPKDYRIIQADGKLVMFDDANSQYKPQNTIVTGMTEEYLPGVGYCLVAKEWKTDDKGNVTQDPPREILLQPAGPAKEGAIREAQHSVQTGTFINDKGRMGGKTLFDVEEANILAKLWEQDVVDSQLAEFKRYPVELPNPKKGETKKSLNKTLYLGKYEIKVTRNTDLTGATNWDVLYQDRETGETKFETAYSSETDVQLDIELLSQGQNAFMVPLAGLEKVYDANKIVKLKYANTGSPKSSAPYLDSDFLKEMQGLENQIKMPYEVASFLRSNFANKNLGAAATNSHVVGRGIDVFGHTEKGKKIKAWLEANSSGGKINNSSLSYSIIQKAGKDEEIIQIFMK